jgi:hypothetical protein
MSRPKQPALDSVVSSELQLSAVQLGPKTSVVRFHCVKGKVAVIRFIKSRSTAAGIASPGRERAGPHELPAEGRRSLLAPGEGPWRLAAFFATRPEISERHSARHGMGQAERGLQTNLITSGSDLMTEDAEAAAQLMFSGLIPLRV